MLINEDELPRDSSKVCIGGLFRAAKNGDEDRVIIDRHAEYQIMEHLRWDELASRSCFWRLLLGPKEFLCSSWNN